MLKTVEHARIAGGIVCEMCARFNDGAVTSDSRPEEFSARAKDEGSPKPRSSPDNATGSVAAATDLRSFRNPRNWVWVVKVATLSRNPVRVRSRPRRRTRPAASPRSSGRRGRPPRPGCACSGSGCRSARWRRRRGLIWMALASVPVARGTPRTCTGISCAFAVASSRSKTRGLMFGPRKSTGPPPHFDVAELLLVVARRVGGVADVHRDADGRVDAVGGRRRAAQADLLRTVETP